MPQVLKVEHKGLKVKDLILNLPLLQHLTVLAVTKKKDTYLLTLFLRGSCLLTPTIFGFIGQLFSGLYWHREVMG